MNDQRPLHGKLRKARQSPRLFLADAKNPALRILRLFVDAGWPEAKPLVAKPSGFGVSDDEAGWAASINVDLLAAVRASHAALPWLERS